MRQAVSLGLLLLTVPVRRLHSYTWFLTALTAYLLIGSCQSTTQSLTDPVLAEGQRLATKHCGTCHLPVSPAALDKKTWVNHVLPAMASNLGLEAYPGNQYYAGKDAAVSYDDWQQIISYYETLAPETLEPAPKPTPPVGDWAIFSPRTPPRDTTRIAVTTMVAIDTLGHQLYSGDATRSGLYRWDRQLRPALFSQLSSAAVGAQFFRDETGHERGLFTCLGTMRAADIAEGELVSLALDGPRGADSANLSRNLPRPVQSVAADFDRDGRTDWVVCGFGHLAGGLFWLNQQADHQFVKRPIRDVPGACQAVPGDFNADGWTDLMVLFAHADEGIWLFLNDRKGGFTERNLLRFPPVNGSTSFQLVDVNRDGQPDIVYTCGDNSDYSKVLKPYHGLYIYLNQGGFRYKQASFYPINGCTKAVTTDFDLDGDLDILTIAFFADLARNPTEGCLYFEQKNPMQFQPHALPVSSLGRWICMDVNDWDQDGDPDVVLGNFSQGFLIQAGVKPDWDVHLPLIVLKNNVRP